VVTSHPGCPARQDDPQKRLAKYVQQNSRSKKVAISGIPKFKNHALSLSVMAETSFHNVRKRAGICSGIFTSPTVR
jgi:hypothetical protein